MASEEGVVSVEDRLRVQGSKEGLRRLSLADDRDMWKRYALAATNDPRMRMCAVVVNGGPNGEPLACAYDEGHDGDHSWASLPTFPEGARS